MQLNSRIRDVVSKTRLIKKSRLPSVDANLLVYRNVIRDQLNGNNLGSFSVHNLVFVFVFRSRLSFSFFIFRGCHYHKVSTLARQILVKFKNLPMYRLVNTTGQKSNLRRILDILKLLSVSHKYL